MGDKKEKNIAISLEAAIQLYKGEINNLEDRLVDIIEELLDTPSKKDLLNEVISISKDLEKREIIINQLMKLWQNKQRKRHHRRQ